MHHPGKALGKILKKGMQIAVGGDRLRNLQQRLVSIGKRLTGRSGWPIHSHAVWRINQRRLKGPLIERISCESPGASERLVRAVAERRGLGMLALAQRHFLRFRQRKLKRLNPGSCMGSVTEGLVP
jgi:hypothetical protein